MRKNRAENEHHKATVNSVYILILQTISQSTDLWLPREEEPQVEENKNDEVDSSRWGTG